MKKRRISVLLKVLISTLLLFTMFSCKSGTNGTLVVEDVKETFRVVSIASVNGSATVTRGDGEKVAAYEGMSLYDGDDVVVDDNSNIVINADSDKHLLAEAGTHFWLTIEGTEELSNTKINLEKGAVLCQIEEKLVDGESFDVVTATSTMCVRGTVFRVNSLETEDNKYDVVEVYNGKVWSNITDSENEVTLEPGQCAMVQTPNDDSTKASYVTDDQLDSNTWTNGDAPIVIKDSKDGKGSNVLPIAYDRLPKASLEQLLKIGEEGKQELSITQDALNNLIETNSERENQEVTFNNTFVEYPTEEVIKRITETYSNTYVDENGYKVTETVEKGEYYQHTTREYESTENPGEKIVVETELTDNVSGAFAYCSSKYKVWSQEWMSCTVEVSNSNKSKSEEHKTNVEDNNKKEDTSQTEENTEENTEKKTEENTEENTEKKIEENTEESTTTEEKKSSVSGGTMGSVGNVDNLTPGTVSGQ